MVDNFLLLYVLFVHHYFFVFVKTYWRSVRQHGYCQTARNLEDVRILHHLQSTVNIARKTLELGVSTIERKIQLHFFLFSRVKINSLNVGIRIVQFETIFIHF